MKTPTEELETPYLDREFEFVVPTYGLSGSLAHAIDESPFANFVGVAGTETSQPPQSGLEPQELETLELDAPMAETWTGKETGYEADEQTYDHDVLEEGEPAGFQLGSRQEGQKEPHSRMGDDDDPTV